MVSCSPMSSRRMSSPSGGLPLRSMNLHVPKGPGEKRLSAGLGHGACGADWRAGSSLPGSQQKSLLHSGMLRSIFSQRYQCWRVTSRVADQCGYGGHESRGPLSCFCLCGAVSGNMQPKLAPGEPGRKKKPRTGPGMMRGPVACLGGSAGGW